VAANFGTKYVKLELPRCVSEVLLSNRKNSELTQYGEMEEKCIELQSCDVVVALLN